MTADTGKPRADLILEAIDTLVERLLVVDREDDDQLLPGDVGAAIVNGEITIEHMAAQFAQELRARLCICPPDLLARGGFQGGCPVHASPPPFL